MGHCIEGNCEECKESRKRIAESFDPEELERLRLGLEGGLTTRKVKRIRRGPSLAEVNAKAVADFLREKEVTGVMISPDPQGLTHVSFAVKGNVKAELVEVFSAGDNWPADLEDFATTIKGD